jgi:hypothetical protein
MQYWYLDMPGVASSFVASIGFLAIWFPTMLGIVQWFWHPELSPKRSRALTLVLCLVMTALIWAQQHFDHKQHEGEIQELPTRKQFSDLKDQLDQEKKRNRAIILSLADKDPIVSALDAVKQAPGHIEGPDVLDPSSTKTILEDKLFANDAGIAQSRLKNAQLAESIMKDAEPAFNYAVITLTRYLTVMASKTGNQVSTNYNGTVPVFKESGFAMEYATVDIVNNPNWQFQVSFGLQFSPSQRVATMRIVAGPPNNYWETSTATVDYKLGRKGGNFMRGCPCMELKMDLTKISRLITTNRKLTIF